MEPAAPTDDPARGEVVVSKEAIARRVADLGAQITADYEGRAPLLVGVLKGAFVFMADLARAIDLPVEFDFMAVSSYGAATKTSGVVRIVKDLDLDLSGRHVIIVEDIIDSGLTLQYLRRNLLAREPASLEVCAMLVREGQQKGDLGLRYVGFSIPPEFVIGYGLDVAERYRNLPDVRTYKGPDVAVPVHPPTEPGPGVDQDRIAAAIRELLAAIGEDVDRQGLLDTPDRVARMWAEVASGLHEDPRRHLKVTFEADHDEMVMVRDIPLYSMCEHHLVPFMGTAHVAYIPNDDGRVIGLSKIARLVDGYARRPQVQERLTSQVADALAESLQPKGVMVVVEAEHLCMSMRGVRKAGSSTVTSAVRGLFRSSVATRQEAMRFVTGGEEGTEAMHKAAPAHDQGDEDLEVGRPTEVAAGPSAVLHSVAHAVREMGVGRSLSSLLKVNQVDGFDCPGCAWPDPDRRSQTEFCENGAKAVAEEATRRRVTADLFARHSIADLAGRSDHWLGQQGRLAEPVVRRPGATHYQPITYAEAYDLVADELAALADPDEAIFYTSGRTSNEAAFAYQLLVRAFGTNNLPDCSNMCHESSGAALSETIGIGKGTVSLEDVEDTDLVIICGQNPGTNHPRMLTSLERAKAGGARIVAVNPLPEAGLLRFKNPQRASGIVGSGTDLADRFLQIRVNGDLALFQAVGARLIARGAIDHDFVAEHTDGFDAYAAHLADLDPEAVRAATGLGEDEIDGLVDEVVAADRIIVCWAMGLTQHRNSVVTIREIVNFLLLRGNIGRQGAGACPVRGHSNVQGDRTMGIYEKPAPAFLEKLGTEFGFTPPADDGHDTVDAIRALRDGRARTFFAMGGNFLAAAPDTEATAAALAGARLTAHVSTKLNRSHTCPGEVSLILPCRGRTDVDPQADGPQHVSVEDSMGMVHASRGHLDPPAPDVPSEVEVVSQIARRLVADRTSADWVGMQADYGRIRDHISRVVPGFEDYDARVVDGFRLPNGPRDSRTFATATGTARFTVNPLEVLTVPEGRLLLQTIRSHDQYNTTIYGLDDRYRGISQGRRVVFAHPDDLTHLGLADGDVVDVVSEWEDGERRAPRFRLVAYPAARGTCAAYFPEANVLVPLDSTADVSGTPTSKSIIVRFERT